MSTLQKLYYAVYTTTAMNVQWYHEEVMYVYKYEGWNRYSIYSYIDSVTQVFKYQKNIRNDFNALIFAYVIIKYRFKGILEIITRNLICVFSAYTIL